MRLCFVRLRASGRCSHGPVGRPLCVACRRGTTRRAVATVLLVSACALCGCSFSGKPPLPKHASIEHLGKPAGTDFAAVVENADVIYFPTNRAASGFIGAFEPRPFARGRAPLAANDTKGARKEHEYRSVLVAWRETLSRLETKAQPYSCLFRAVFASFAASSGFLRAKGLVVSRS